jgi:hypothetical protein
MTAMLAQQRQWAIPKRKARGRFASNAARVPARAIGYPQPC